MGAWVDCIKYSSSSLDRQESKKNQNQKYQTGEQKIDKMLSDLVVYCQTVPFDFEGWWSFYCLCRLTSRLLLLKSIASDQNM